MLFAYTRPRYIYRTIGHLVISRIVHQYVSLLRTFWKHTFKKDSSNTKLCFCLYVNHTKQNVDLISNKDNCYILSTKRNAMFLFAFLGGKNY